MGRISEADVAAANDAIAQAATTYQAFQLINGATRTMLARLLDLNGHDVNAVGLGFNGQTVLGWSHGWDWAEQDDNRPADGKGPCPEGFDLHGHRPGRCRHCFRRRIDHRPVMVSR